MGLALAVGVFCIYWGFLTFLDWQWLNKHFSSGGSSHWTSDVIAGFLTGAIFFFAVGGLGIITFLFGFMKVRKALDDDNQDAIKRWSILTGIVGALPGVALSGLLEMFIWRAHASEKFTIFGLLGRAPEPEPEPPSAMVIANQQAAEDEARRKDEYAALFGGAPQRTAPKPSPNYGYSAPAYDQGQPAAAPAAAESPYTAPQEAFAPPQAPAPEPAAAEAAAGEPQQMHEQPSGAPICTCGRPMEWIAEYGRYYCYTDDRYEGET